MLVFDDHGSPLTTVSDGAAYRDGMRLMLPAWPGAGERLACRALYAFGKGAYRETIGLLEPLARGVARIGGSGAQREVIEDTLLLAYMHADATEKAQAPLDRRLHRRPSPRDSLWRSRLAA